MFTVVPFRFIVKHLDIVCTAFVVSLTILEGGDLEASLLANSSLISTSTFSTLFIREQVSAELLAILDVTLVHISDQGNVDSSGLVLCTAGTQWVDSLVGFCHVIQAVGNGKRLSLEL